MRSISFCFVPASKSEKLLQQKRSNYLKVVWKDSIKNLFKNEICNISRKKYRHILCNFLKKTFFFNSWKHINRILPTSTYRYINIIGANKAAIKCLIIDRHFPNTKLPLLVYNLSTAYMQYAVDKLSTSKVPYKVLYHYFKI